MHAPSRDEEARGPSSCAPEARAGWAASMHAPSRSSVRDESEGARGASASAPPAASTGLAASIHAHRPGEDDAEASRARVPKQNRKPAQQQQQQQQQQQSSTAGASRWKAPPEARPKAPYRRHS
ncbi:hypothetical protein BV25DRAFT_1826101 [Artomyces pyxidatus]|uniref:Uncharacterized protein n=1 Tax=Artomyces pyxidatus TaxID=48021 RepID=A0ACB8T043_9AGAM|nr:hypothetical protein BV25DRAFT_1826101 [Artomyces pyxidatus]